MYVGRRGKIVCDVCADGCWTFQKSTYQQHLPLPPIFPHVTIQPSSGAFDLVVSADVLVYYGHLEYILGTLARALKPHKGLLAFTLEALKDGDEQLLRQQKETGKEGEEEWILRDTGRAWIRDFATSIESIQTIQMLTLHTHI